MRHKKSGRQFGRDTSSRRAMLRSLAANLITHERIHTTDAKAKELRRVAEGLIGKALRLGKTAHTPHADLSVEERAKRLHISRYLAAYLPRWGVKADGNAADLEINAVMRSIETLIRNPRPGPDKVRELRRWAATKLAPSSDGEVPDRK